MKDWEPEGVSVDDWTPVRSETRRSWWPVIGAIVVVAALVGVFFLVRAIYRSYSAESVVVATVCGKEAVPLSDSDGNNNGHEYRVYTSQGTFVVKDHFVNGIRTLSADTYGRIQPGVTYKITSYGWRNGLLSMFPNIEKAERVPDSEQQPKACDK